MKNVNYQELENVNSLIERVSSSTGLSEQNIEEQLLETNIRLFSFEGTTLISPEEFDTIINGWADTFNSTIR